MLAQEIDPSALARVRADLQTVDAGSAALMARQKQVVTQLVGELSEIISAAPAVTGGMLSPTQLNEVAAPHLPLLLGRGYAEAARSLLHSGKVRTEPQRAALAVLSEFVATAQQEVADELTAMQWKQQEKLRELCDAAAEGGTPRLQEVAAAMREELDTDFCNFMNAEIEAEEGRLRATGVSPCDGGRFDFGTWASGRGGSARWT
jgi:hypothetical protein